MGRVLWTRFLRTVRERRHEKDEVGRQDNGEVSGALHGTIVVAFSSPQSDGNHVGVERSCMSRAKLLHFILLHRYVGNQWPDRRHLVSVFLRHPYLIDMPCVGDRFRAIATGQEHVRSSALTRTVTMLG